MTTIIVLAGSLRKDSLNKKLAQAVTKLLQDKGVQAEFIDLKDYPMPLFDQDVEAQGTQEQALALKKKWIEADGIIICSPEYNSSYPGVLKNAIDWISRTFEEEPSAFKTKVVGLMAASPGGLGGIRMLPQLRTLMANVGCIVVPTMVSIGKANAEMFDNFENDRANACIQEVIDLCNRNSV